MTNEPSGAPAPTSRRDVFSFVAISCAIVALAFSIGAFVLASSASTDADEAVHMLENTPMASESTSQHADEGHDEAMPMDEGAADEHAAFAFGEAASAEAATRTIEIEAVDIAFKPTSVEVAHGETVLFRIHNSGEAVHDFTIGDAKTQKAHDREMAKLEDPTAGHHGDGNAVVIEPGETAELAFTFTSAGDFIFGCHIPGHYAAGMRGTLTVAE